MLADFSQSAVSLLPPIVALGMAIISRRVLLSLGLGILLGAILLNDFSLGNTADYIFTAVSGLFWEEGGINAGNMSILAFLVLLGMTTALLTLSGGTAAFAEWAQKHIRTKRGAKLLAAFLGVFIFVDDYFNSLAVGSISRPVTDRFHISRAKLAYILDSTAAPMCVIMPASSWGAYIITVISGILVSHGITEYTPLGAFMTLVPMNLYAIFALLLVFAVAWFQMDIGPMRRHEMQAAHCADEKDAMTPSLEDELEINESEHGRVSDLIMPIVVLVVATIGAMLFTGYQSLAEAGKPFDLLGAFENTVVGTSLCYGGLIGLASALYTVFRQRLPATDISNTLWIGAKSMFGAILILLFAWTIGGIIGDMKTGQYLSHMAQAADVNPHYLPAILFTISAVMAFSTGTSWGTFGIMLPIAGDMAAATEIALILPMLGAVLAGAVFGDHCSPISDTTILSSTGARCSHIDHVSTQLPYALAGAVISAVGYLVIGLTESLLIGFMAAFVMFIVVILSFMWLSRRPNKQIQRA